MFDNLAISIGILLIIFIVIIFLVIFAPKCQNFFDKTDFPNLDELSKNEELLLDTSVRLNIVESENLDDETIEKLETIKENIPFNDLKWEKWPDKTIISGDVSILPVIFPNKETTENKKIFEKLLKYIDDKKIPVNLLYFIKLEPNSRFLEHKGYAEMTNDTLRYIYCFNSYCYEEKECGIWVNYEAKKTINGNSFIYDASKNHSLYNNIVDVVIYLVIDFKRPDDVPNGYSDYMMPKEVSEFFTKPV